jgi:biotin transporter BioY
VPSSVVVVTPIASLLGFAINVLVMSVILLRGRRKYHLLFALLLFVAACWDLGIFLIMIRNDFPDEVLLYLNVMSIPFSMFPTLIYHFTTTYLNQPRKKSTIALYV